MTPDKYNRLLEMLADSPTALVCNAYDFMGLHAPCTDWNIRYATPAAPPVTGVAITIKLWCSTPDDLYIPEPSHRGGQLFSEMMEQARTSGMPRIAVIQSMGEKHRGAVLGDGMAKSMLAAGICGCVTDGAARDIEGIEKTGLRLFCGGLVPNHYSLHWAGLGEPAEIGGLVIKTGDILHGDRDGVIVLPEEGWGRVVSACRLAQDFEKSAHVLARRRDLTPAQIDSEIGALARRCRASVSELADEL